MVRFWLILSILYLYCLSSDPSLITAHDIIPPKILPKSWIEFLNSHPNLNPGCQLTIVNDNLTLPEDIIISAKEWQQLESSVEELKDVNAEKAIVFVDEQDQKTRDKLASELADVANHANELQDKPVPRFITPISENSYLMIESTYAQSKHVLVRVDGDVRAYEADLELLKPDPEATLDYATFDEGGRVLAIAFRPPGSESGTFAFMTINGLKVEFIGQGKWDKFPHLALTSDRRGVISNILITDNNKERITLVRTRFNATASLMSTVFNKPGYYRLVPHIYQRIFCVEAFPFHGLTSSLHCGHLFLPNQCVKDGAKLKKITGDDKTDRVTMSGSDGIDIVYYTSDNEHDLGAVYQVKLSTMIHTKLFYNQSESLNLPILSAIVKNQTHYMIIRGDYKISTLELQLGLNVSYWYNFNFTSLFYPQTLFQFGIVSFMTTDYFISSKGYLIKNGKLNIIKGYEETNQLKYQIDHNFISGVPYTHIQSKNITNYTQCHWDIQTSSGLATYTLPLYTTSTRLSLSHPCTNVIIIHPRGIQTLGRQWKLNGTGENFINHINDIRTILHHFNKFPEKKLVTGHLLTLLHTQKLNCLDTSKHNLQRREMDKTNKHQVFLFDTTPATYTTPTVPYPAYVSRDFNWSGFKKPLRSKPINTLKRQLSRRSIINNTINNYPYYLSPYDGEYFLPNSTLPNLSDPLYQLPKHCLPFFQHFNLHIDNLNSANPLALQVHKLASYHNENAYLSVSRQFTDEHTIFRHAKLHKLL